MEQHGWVSSINCEEKGEERRGWGGKEGEEGNMRGGKRGR